MPNIAAPVRALSAAARRAAYISPLASPADKRILGACIVGRGLSRLQAWEQGRTALAPNSCAERAAPALCIAAGRGGSRCRATPEAPGEHPVREAGPCETRVSGLRAGLCSGDAR